MTIHVSALLGRVEEPRFANRQVVEVPVAWDEAGRRRLRRRAADGTDVAIALRTGEYLADGAVLADDGTRLLAVARRLEAALVIRFDLDTPPERLLAGALALGHAFGNQHVPIEIAEGEVRVPLATGETVARATVDALALERVSVTTAPRALGRLRPLPVGHAHTHELSSTREHLGVASPPSDHSHEDAR